MKHLKLVIKMEVIGFDRFHRVKDALDKMGYQYDLE